MIYLRIEVFPDAFQLRDRFKKLIADWRVLDKTQLNQSGSSNAYGEKEALLTDLVARMDAFESEKQDTKDGKTAKDEKLAKDGADVRKAAMDGMQSSKRPKLSSGINNQEFLVSLWHPR